MHHGKDRGRLLAPHIPDEGRHAPSGPRDIQIHEADRFRRIRQVRPLGAAQDQIHSIPAFGDPHAKIHGYALGSTATHMRNEYRDSFIRGWNVRLRCLR